MGGINGCGDDEEGLCPLESFVSSVQQLVDETDFAQECDGSLDASEAFEEAQSEDYGVEIPVSEEQEEKAEESEEGQQEEQEEQEEQVSAVEE